MCHAVGEKIAHFQPCTVVCSLIILGRHSLFKVTICDLIFYKIASLFFPRREADGAFLLGIQRDHELAYGVNQFCDRAVMCADLAFQLVEFLRKLFVGRNQFAQMNEGAHDMDADFYGASRVEHAGRHDGTVFSKGEW